MNIEELPWATSVLAIWMIALFLFDPRLDNGVEYFLLSPWMHSDFNHFWNNMVFFLPLGIYVERQVGGISFVVFAALIPYLALHLPVVWGLGGLSHGASGLTKALTGYTMAALLVDLSGRLEGFTNEKVDRRRVSVAIGILVVLVFLTNNSLMTVQRFIGLAPSPADVSVASHLFGLTFGILWFGWRGWRHGVFDET